MQVKVSGRHMGVGDPLKAYCAEKAEKLEKYLNSIHSVEVILDGKDGKHSAEIIAHNKGSASFVAHEGNDDAFAAFDLALHKIEEQIRRHKEKLRNRKHGHAGHHNLEENE